MTPIFQMTLEPDGLNAFGLLFSEETKKFNQPVFVLPIKDYREWWNQTYYMPGEINGNYRDFLLTFNKGIFELNDEAIKYTIRFGIGYGDILSRIHPFDLNLIYEVLPMKYLGKHKELIGSYDRFIPLVPLDLLIMDNAYRENQACFVGLTPIFGYRRNQ